MRRLLLSLLVLAFTLPAIAQAKHPFTFEDMMKLKRVGDPQVSPDGKWVIFSVVDVDLEANTKTPHIWIVPTAGGQEQRNHRRSRWRSSALGAGRKALRVSLDERRRIAGLDRRVRWRGGNVTGMYKFTSIATEASGELWSPDGKNILFTSDVYPECDGAASDRSRVQREEAGRSRANPKSKRRSSLICSIAIGMHIKKASAPISLLAEFPRSRTCGATESSINCRIDSRPAISLPATTMRPCSRSAGRMTMPSRPTGRRFATPRITTRIRRLRRTTICGSSRSM